MDTTLNLLVLTSVVGLATGQIYLRSNSPIDPLTIEPATTCAQLNYEPVIQPLAHAGERIYHLESGELCRSQSIMRTSLP